MGAVRFLPRGVRSEDYARGGYFDVWLPTVAPKAELIAWLREKPVTEERWKRFAARYAASLKKETDARQTVALLAEVAKRTPVAVGCYCEDESRCHRSLLVDVIRNAGRTS